MRPAAGPGPVAAAAAVLAALVSLLLATGCSSAPRAFQQRATERRLAAEVGVGLPAKVRSVTCPERPPRAEGSTFTCAVVLDDVGGSARLEVLVGADDALAGTLLDAVVDRTALGEEVRRRLVDEHRRAFAVDCGEDVRIVRPGTTLTCTVDDDGEERTAEVAVVDAAGSLAITVER